MNAVNQTNRFLILAIAIGALLMSATGMNAALADDTANPAAGKRVATVKQIASGGRDGRPGESVRHEYAALATTGQRAATPGKSAAVSAKPGSNDFWFYAADVVLFGDDDGDGYFYGIDLLFDADTAFDEVDVYAAVFLSFEGGPWNEYAVTSDFTIYGATSDDEYVIITELETGYPAGSYDLLIELYDAVDGAFLASFEPADSSSLSYLPLEDLQRDKPYIDSVVIIDHGGGNGYGLLGLLLLVPLLRLRKRLSGAARGRAA